MDKFLTRVIFSFKTFFSIITFFSHRYVPSFNLEVIYIYFPSQTLSSFYLCFFLPFIVLLSSYIIVIYALSTGQGLTNLNLKYPSFRLLRTIDCGSRFKFKFKIKIIGLTHKDWTFYMKLLYIMYRLPKLTGMHND